ncbi:NAD(P)H oxidoreductase RTN4IP1, mitochondrial-like isoform X2 [Rhynchophorus ferrugineus]|uniref:NAD(P)H oxidoreductase RTN4IP1, mitochondrial-like isoform X2 n=1 Tax=Rhynchophorus ferrugineus TaxID=354439 RepID=UPI003FCEB78F
MDELLFRSNRGIESMQAEIAASKTKDFFNNYSRQVSDLFKQIWSNTHVNEIKGVLLEVIKFVIDVSSDVKKYFIESVDLKYLSLFLTQTFGNKWTKREITLACVGFLVGGLIGAAVGYSIRSTQTPYRYMQAIQVVRYMGPESVAVLQDAQAPYECGDFDVLVNVKAASVQVIDAQICCGYGRNFRKILRKLYNESDLPVTLGRDCTGIITDLGRKVKRLEIGDEVWVTLPYWSQGTLCQTILVSENRVAHKPKNVGFEGACSIPYAGSIALSTLSEANIDSNNAQNKSFLIQGGCTPVGCVLIQLLKSWKADVTATCYKRAVPVAEALGANEVITVEDPENAASEINSNNMKSNKNLLKQLEHINKQFDFIILTKNESADDFKTFCTKEGQILSTYPPQLASDSLGYLTSLLFTSYIYLKVKISWFGSVYDDFDEAHLCHVTLEKLTELVEDGVLQTVVDKVFPPRDIELALQHIQSPYSIGSAVITFR